MKIESVLDWTRRLRPLIALGVLVAALSASAQVSFDALAKELTTAKSPVTTDQGAPAEPNAEQVLDGSEMPKSAGSRSAGTGKMGSTTGEQLDAVPSSGSQSSSGNPFEVWARPMAIGIFGAGGIVLVALRLRRIAPRPR